MAGGRAASPFHFAMRSPRGTFSVASVGLLVGASFIVGARAGIDRLRRQRVLRHVDRQFGDHAALVIPRWGGRADLPPLPDVEYVLVEPEPDGR